MRREIIWSPQPGPQTRLAQCPVEDVLYGGARGGGKTDGLLGDFLLYQNRYGGNARGILFRRSYPELEEVEQRALGIYSRSGAQWKAQARTWVFPNGATLRMRYINRDADAESYQGHSYQWMGVDEAGNFASPRPLDKLRATLRSPHGIPVRLRMTANPGGPGHNWLKARYVDPSPPGKVFTANPGDGVGTVQRVFIPALLDDNRILTENDPNYWSRIEASAAGNDALLKAWRDGDWDIVSGGMFDDLWKRDVHVIKPFKIPSSWRVDRSFDWGSSKPFSVGWWAESDGTNVTLYDGGTTSYPRGTLIRISEWYGWNGRPNEGLKMGVRAISEGIKDREKGMGIDGRCKAGPGDCPATVPDQPDVREEFARHGVQLTEPKKSPGSREAGWQLLRERLMASAQSPMEDPGLFIFDTCTHFIRTVPVLPRDDKRYDDIDTNAEDHIADEARYRILLAKPSEPAIFSTVGYFGM